MYIISPVTVFDEENELFETKIGLDNKEMTLLISAWGPTQESSRKRATDFVELLILAERNMINDIPPHCRTYPLTNNDMIQPHEPVKRH